MCGDKMFFLPRKMAAPNNNLGVSIPVPGPEGIIVPGAPPPRLPVGSPVGGPVPVNNGGLAATLATGTEYRNAMRASSANVAAPLIPFDILLQRYRPAYFKLQYVYAPANPAAAALADEVSSAYAAYTKKLLREYIRLVENGEPIPEALEQEVHGVQSSVPMGPHAMQVNVPKPRMKGYAVTIGNGTPEHGALVENIGSGKAVERFYKKQFELLQRLLAKSKIGTISQEEREKGRNIALMLETAYPRSQDIWNVTATFRKVLEELERAEIEDMIRALPNLIDRIIQGTATDPEKDTARNIVATLRPLEHIIVGAPRLLAQYSVADQIHDNIYQFIPRLDAIIAKIAPNTITEAEKANAEAIIARIEPALVPLLDRYGFGDKSREISGKIAAYREGLINKNITTLRTLYGNINAGRNISPNTLERVGLAVGRLGVSRPAEPLLQRQDNYSLKMKINTLLKNPDYTRTKPRLLDPEQYLNEQELLGLQGFVTMLKEAVERLVFDDAYKREKLTLIGQLEEAIRAKIALLARQAGQFIEGQYRRNFRSGGPGGYGAGAGIGYGPGGRGYGGKSRRRAHTKKHKKHSKKTRKH